MTQVIQKRPLSRHLLGLGPALTLSLAPLAYGQVSFDGSMGPIGSLSGDMVISNDYGTQVGENLFHSFSVFNVLTGESATFTSNFAGLTRNVIARVTGGSNSLIDGTLSNAVSGADLWLINPAGVVFGDNATIDVQGSFHASTADYLLLEDGGRFPAQLDDAAGTILTMGNPSHFGFLGPSAAAIEVGAAAFTVAEGGALTLTGGEISLMSSRLGSAGGQVGLAAVSGEGELGWGNEGFSLQGISGRGDITMNGSLVDVSAEGGGEVFIVGGRFVMQNRAAITSRSADLDGGQIGIEVTSAEMSGASSIGTGTTGNGHAGDISLTASGDVTLSGGSQLTSITRGNGASGDITLTAGGDFIASGWDDATGGVSALLTDSKRLGNAGDIEVSANNVVLENGGQINSSSSYFGDSGNVRVTAGESIYMAGESGDGEFSGIITANTSRGNAGDVSITTGDLTMLDGASIFGATGTYGGRNGGDAANVTIQASGDILAAGVTTFRNAQQGSGIYAMSFTGGAGGVIDISANSLTMESGAFFWAGALGGGNAGQVLIRTTGDMSISSQPNRFSAISVESYGAGNGGLIDIQAQNIYVLDGAEIILRATDSEGGSPGRLSFAARDSIVMRATKKFSSVFAEGFGEGASSADITFKARVIEIDRGQITINTRGTDGSAGTITLDASERIILTGESEVGSNAIDATQLGSNIVIRTKLLEISDQSSLITNTFGIGLGAGSIFIQVDDLVVDSGTIEAEACSCSTGQAGSIEIAVAGTISLSGTEFDGQPAGIRSRTFGAGNGGTIEIRADQIVISEGAAIIASSEATAQDFIDQGLPGNEPGSAGNIFVSANGLELNSGGSITATAREAAGGSISLDVADIIYLTDAAITAEAQGVTPEDDGGNVTIAEPVALVMNHSAIRANANAGNGGNINITAEVLVPSADSVIDASSKTGIDGQVVIDSPNQAVSSVALLNAPVLDVSELVQDPCEVDLAAQRSSLTVEGQGGLLPAPDEYQPGSPAKGAPESRGPGRQFESAQAGQAQACGRSGP